MIKINNFESVIEEELIDFEPPEVPKVLPDHYKWIALISYAGNILIGFVFLFFSITAMVSTSFLTEIDETSVSYSKATVYSLVFVASTVACVLCIIGLTKMSKRQFRGFKIFLIGNFLWLLINLFWMFETWLSIGFFPLLFSAAFCLYFYSLRHHLE